MSLNSREIALLLWLGVFALCSITKPSLRSTAATCFKILIRHPIGTVFAVAAAYVVGCVWVLARLQIWTPDNLKTTILWWLTFAFIAVVTSNKIDEERSYFRKSVREIVSATVLIAFIADSYTFSLPLELALVPAIVFISLLSGVAGANPEHRAVERLAAGILALIGFAILAKGIIEVIKNLSEFTSLGTARDFVVPVLLSFMFLPFLYGLNLYHVYQTIFVGLNFGIEDDSLRRRAKLRAMLTFRNDLDFLKRWRRLVLMERPVDGAALNRTFQEVREIEKWERRPPSVGNEEGWSPYIAAEFLLSEGLVTEDYHRSYEDRWVASSKPLKLDDDFLPDTITFHIEGTSRAATQLRLVLHVADAVKHDVNAAECQFSILVLKLTRQTTDADLSTSIADDEFQLQLEDARITLLKDEWDVGHRRGYEHTFTIRHKAHCSEAWDL